VRLVKPHPHPFCFLCSHNQNDDDNRYTMSQQPSSQSQASVATSANTDVSPEDDSTNVDAAAAEANVVRDSGPSGCKKFCDDAGTKRGQALVAMAIGMTVSNKDDTMLFDEKTEPWRSMDQRSLWVPTLTYLTNKIHRCFTTYIKTSKKPRCANWKRERMFEWLMLRPVKHEHDTKWIRESVIEYRTKMANVVKEKQAAKEKESLEPRFDTLSKYMRLTLAFFHEDCKLAFKEHDLCLNHSEIEE
jgi:hypothetical protein